MKSSFERIEPEGCLFCFKMGKAEICFFEQLLFLNVIYWSMEHMQFWKKIVFILLPFAGAFATEFPHAEWNLAFGLTDLYKDPNDPSNAPERYYYFAFDEGNIMSSFVPPGERLRYRPLFVVNTGTNDRIPIENGWYATENQWDCLRSTSKCYK